MTIRRFLAPNLLALLILGIAWTLGYENILKEERNDQVNLQKYIQVQRVILDNHYNEVNIEKLYLSSLKGFVRNLETEDLTLTDTPLDTTVSELPIGSLRESVQHF